MKVVIADDEAPARARLRALAGELPGVEVAGEAATGQQAVQACQRLRPDVVLLDIRMPGMDGLEAARHLAGLQDPPAVVFTTAFSEHALAAFDAQAVDYLLKPVRKARLEQALHKAARLGPERLGELSRGVAGGPAARTHLSAHHRGGIVLVPVDDVYCLVAGDKYVSVHHAGGELLIAEPLKALEEEFGPRFVRVHRGALAARARIAALERGADGRHTLRLSDGSRLPVSRRHVAALRAMLRAGHPATA